MKGLVAAKSEIDKSFQMFVIYSEHEKYASDFAPIFKSHGLGFLVPGKKQIYIDGESLEDLTYDHLLAIQAHEISHYRLKHKGDYSEKQELEADVEGYKILVDGNYTKAAVILRQRIKDHYGKRGLKMLGENKINNNMKNIKTIEDFLKEKRGLWDNVHAKRKRGEKPAKPGDEDYPEEDAWEDAKKKSKVTEASRGKVHKAVKKGSYPVTLVVISNGMVVKQKLVDTPEAVPAHFNTLQKEYPNANISVEDNTGKRLFSESVSEIKRSMISGTSGRTIDSLEDRKYELKKDVEGARIGDYTNITLPKGTIIYNLPGGVMADHKSLKRYADRNMNRYFDKPTFKGISVRQMPDILAAIEKNSKVLESVNEGKMPGKYIGNDEIVFIKTKEDSRGAQYSLYYKGYDIDAGGQSFGSEKELKAFASNYILSNQWYNKLKHKDAKPLPESVNEGLPPGYSKFLVSLQTLIGDIAPNAWGNKSQITPSSVKRVHNSLKKRYGDDYAKFNDLLKTQKGQFGNWYLKESVNEAASVISMPEAEKVWDALVKKFSDNKNDSIEYLNKDKSYRNMAIMAIFRATKF